MGSQEAERKTSVILLDSFADNLKEMHKFLKKLLVILFFGLFAIPPSAFCQVDTAWVRRYNGPGDKTDEIRGLVVDDSGNVVITGYSGDGSSTWDFVTIKYDRTGNQLWLQNCNGVTNSGNMPSPFDVDKKGNVYVTGGLWAGKDCITIKYDSNGNQIWTARYNGPINGSDEGEGLTVDENGNVYVIGVSESTNVGGVCGPTYYFDYETLKYDSNGNQLWAARYSNPPDYRNIAYLIAVDVSGNVYVSGYSEHWCLGYREWVTVKYDSTGKQLWVRQYSRWSLASSSAPADLKLDASGNIYVTGGSQDSETSFDYTTIKYDSQGNQLWVTRSNGITENYDFTTAMALDSQENAYVTGVSYAGAEKHNDIVTIKYDSNGNQLWVQSYNGPGSGEDKGMGISLDAAGNVYVAGVSFGNSSAYNYVVLKYDSSGNFIWEKRYKGPVFYYAAENISVDQNGNVHLAGTDTQNAHDFVTIKYSPLPALKGDLNLDGILSMADVVLMLNFAFNGDAFPAAPTAGDLNCDGGVTAADFVIMLQIFFLSAPPPC